MKLGKAQQEVVQNRKNMGYYQLSYPADNSKKMKNSKKTTALTRMAPHRPSTTITTVTMPRCSKYDGAQALGTDPPRAGGIGRTSRSCPRYKPKTRTADAESCKDHLLEVEPSRVP